jgi:hypothetical protein
MSAGERRISAARPEVRLDANGGRWTLPEVEAEIVSIVRDLDPKASAILLTRSTRFARDLGWDDWYELGLLGPVDRKLHVGLSAAVLLERVKSLGDLTDYVWASLRAIP